MLYGWSVSWMGVRVVCTCYSAFVHRHSSETLSGMGACNTHCLAEGVFCYRRNSLQHPVACRQSQLAEIAYHAGLCKSIC
jgi:hypothetical protein